MRRFKIATLFLGLLLGMAAVVSADQQNKKTVFTFKDSVQVPGQTLPAGTYVFKLANSDSNRHIVQIYNQDETKLITTILAIPNYQLQPSGETILTYAKAPANQPVALEAWFYPGDNFGQQFAYPESVATELSTLNTVKVPSTGNEQAYPSSSSDTTSSNATSNSTTTSTSSTTTPSSSSSTTAPAATSDTMTSSTSSSATTTTTDDMKTKRTDDTTPSRSASATTTPDTNSNMNAQSNTSAQNLPQTASPLPLAGLLGLLAVGAATALRKANL